MQSVDNNSPSEWRCTILYPPKMFELTILLVLNSWIFFIQKRDILVIYRGKIHFSIIIMAKNDRPKETSDSNEPNPYCRSFFSKTFDNVVHICRTLRMLSEPFRQNALSSPMQRSSRKQRVCQATSRKSVFSMYSLYP